MKKCSEIKECISLYIDNELGLDEIRDFEEHIAHCEDCRNELNEIIQIVGLCKNTAEVELPENFRTELHSKLLEAQRLTENAGKLMFFQSGYFKLFSSVAAVFLLVFLIRGLYGFNLFPAQKTADSAERMNMAAEAPLQESAQMKSAASEKADDSRGIIDQNSGNEYQIAAADFQGTQAGGQEADRSANDNREAPLTMETSGSNSESITRNQTSITIAADDPAAQVESIRAIALKSGGLEQLELKSDTELAMKAIADDGTEYIELILNIPNMQFNTFLDALKADYGQSITESGEIVAEDMGPVIEGLLKQADSLDIEIEKTENTNSDSKQKEIDKLKDEKIKLQNEIDSIRMGTDIITVKIIIKKK